MEHGYKLCTAHPLLRLVNFPFGLKSHIQSRRFWDRLWKNIEEKHTIPWISLNNETGYLLYIAHSLHGVIESLFEWKSCFRNRHSGDRVQLETWIITNRCKQIYKTQPITHMVEWQKVIIYSIRSLDETVRELGDRCNFVLNPVFPILSRCTLNPNTF